MSQKNSAFEKFDNSVRVADGLEDRLRKSRKALREYILDKLDRPSSCTAVDFLMQGSFALDTMVKPEARPFEVDLDDCVILTFKTGVRVPSAKECLDKLQGVLTGYKNTTVSPQARCVTVEYAGYSIDFPVFAARGDDPLRVADGDADEWFESDPEKITNWFKGSLKDRPHMERRRQIVRALKVFSQVKGIESELTGFVFTVAVGSWHDLASENVEEWIRSVVDRLHDHLSARKPLLNPVNLKEDVLKRPIAKASKSVGRLEKLLSALKELTSALLARDESMHEWSKRMAKHFGKRFPISPDDGKDRAGPDSTPPRSFQARSAESITTRSRPWADQGVARRAKRTSLRSGRTSAPIEVLRSHILAVFPQSVSHEVVDQGVRFEVGLRLCSREWPGSGREDTDFWLRIFVPQLFPVQLPTVHELDGEIPRDCGSHCNADGSLCLELPETMIVRLLDEPPPTRLQTWLDEFLWPYLKGFVFFKERGFWPDGEHPHGEIAKVDRAFAILGGPCTTRRQLEFKVLWITSPEAVMAGLQLRLALARSGSYPPGVVVPPTTLFAAGWVDFLREAGFTGASRSVPRWLRPRRAA